MHRTQRTKNYQSKSKTQADNVLGSSCSETETDTEYAAAATVYSHQEHARARFRVEHALSSSTSTTSGGSLTSKPSLSSSIGRFREDFDVLKCKMKIFGESLNLCHCIANDFKVKLNDIEKRLEVLEKRQVVWRTHSNYSEIIQKNRKLSHKTLEDAKRLQMCKTEEERRQVAARICGNYLHGAWKVVDPNSLLFKRISGGLSNYIYYVALPDNANKLWNTARDSSASEEPNSFEATLQHARSSCSSSVLEEPKNVLLRIYGQVHGERAMDTIVTESVIFTLLSERRLGPKLHGVFNGGRIEEYIPARCLLTKELSEKALSLKIAEKMAAIHSMNVPLNKDPTWLWKNFSKWMKVIREDKVTGNYQPKSNEEKRIINELKDVDFEIEVEWLKRYLNAFTSLVVFCHNDLQEGNILILEDTPVHIHPVPMRDEDSGSGKESSIYVQAYNRNNKVLSSEECDICNSLLSMTSDSDEPRLFLIDFEYCAYNYRGFDIANHFEEWIFDYTNPDYPFYYVLEENTPTGHQKDLFIKHYLKHYTINISDEHDPPLPTTDTINRLREEVEAFSLASHLFWTLWAFVNASKSQIPFGYWEYGYTRFEFYKKLKVDALKNEHTGLRMKSSVINK